MAQRPSGQCFGGCCKFFGSIKECLTLYIKQLAWLRSVPKEASESRLQVFMAKGKDIPLPEIDGASYYLVELLEEIGAVVQSGMGIEPFTWLELNSWLSISCLELSYWELCILKDLSYAYAAELSVADDPDRKPPYMAPETSLAVPNIEDKLKSVFADFAKRNDLIEE